MANAHHLDLLKKGVGKWNQWRMTHSFYPDFSGANLSRINFMDADLLSADFSKANLSGANLSKTILSQANLSGADLSGANLSEAFLLGANLSEVNFSGADLSGTDLSGADLGGADLHRVKVLSTMLIDVNLSGAQLSGLDLRRIDFSGSNMSNTKLRKANLSGLDLRSQDLSGAKLKEADLRGADLSGANLSRANLFKADLRGADLSGANLSRATLSCANLSKATLIETILDETDLTNCTVYGISAWDVRLEGAKQFNLVITPPDQATVTVDNLKVAQFIYLLLNNQELRDVLDSVLERGVLLLGRFRYGGLELLQSIAAYLRQIQYLPMIFDFDRQDSRNLIETTMTLVGLSKFVIVDLSGPSVPYELGRLVPHFRLPFVPIIEEGRKIQIYSMFTELLENDWVLPLVAFTSKEHLIELLYSRIIEPAEMKCEERQARLHQIFNH